MEAAEVAMQNPITIEALGQVLTSVGLSATLILFFVWQNWKREERVATEFVEREKQMLAREEAIVARLQNLEDFTRDKMMGMVRDTGVALSANTEALRNNTAALDRTANTSTGVLTAVDMLHKELREHDARVLELAAKMKNGGGHA